MGIEMGRLFELFKVEMRCMHAWRAKANNNGVFIKVKLQIQPNASKV
jgi:hypothetical protein